MTIPRSKWRPLNSSSGHQPELRRPAPLVGNRKYSQPTFLSDGTPSPGALWPASTRAEAGFILSTIDVGIRIVVPRSLVVSYDVHGTQLQGGGMIGIDLGGLDKLPRDLGFGRPEKDASLFLPLGLGLARHGILQGHRDSDVADLDRGHRYTPSGGLCRLEGKIAVITGANSGIGFQWPQPGHCREGYPSQHFKHLS
jgi:hypothetical protein